MSESQSAQRDDSPMDVDQPSPLDQDPAPLGRTRRVGRALAFEIVDILIESTLHHLDDEGNGQSESEERLPDLPLLSEQLLLDELWDMLGECLKELEESHDQHAVLGK